MNRRDSLKLLGIGLATIPLPAFAAGGLRTAVFDSRFESSNLFARGAGMGFDCCHDAAALWFGSLAPRLGALLPIAGLTIAADAHILADCARDHGLAMSILSRHGQLLEWRLDSRG
jgi:hypothetical protein